MNCSNCENKNTNYFENINDIEILCLKCGLVFENNDSEIRNEKTYKNNIYKRCKIHTTKLNYSIINYIKFLNFSQEHTEKLKVLLNFETIEKYETKQKILKIVLEFSKANKIKLKPLKEHAPYLEITQFHFAKLLKESEIGFFDENYDEKQHKPINGLDDIMKVFHIKSKDVVLRIYNELHFLNSEGENIKLTFAIFIYLKRKNKMKSVKKFIERTKLTSGPTFNKIHKRFSDEIERILKS
tara:strand:- start:1599 stop:2321 length:723 start_codon:yes stop_codon:yes gene_type:complete